MTEAGLGDVVYVGTNSELTGRIVGYALPTLGGASEGNVFVDFGERGVQRYPLAALTKVGGITIYDVEATIAANNAVDRAKALLGQPPEE